MKRAVLLAVSLAVGVLAGCTSAVSGQGSGPSTPAFPASTTPASPTGSATSTLPTTAPTTTPTTAAPTTSPASARGIVDPASVDLCKPIQAASFQATFDDPQLAGSCSLTAHRGAKSELDLGVTLIAPADQTTRPGATKRTVDGLHVMVYPDDGDTCERDITLAQGTVAVSADSFGTPTKKDRCAAADKLTSQEAHALATTALPSRPLASPSLVRLNTCRSVTARDLVGIPGGGVVTIKKDDYGFHCSASSTSLYMGVEVAFHTATIKPKGSTTVSGHHLVWFDARGAGGACDVVSLQKPTADPAIVEALQVYLINLRGTQSSARVCQEVDTEAVKVLNRLGLH